MGPEILCEYILYEDWAQEPLIHIFILYEGCARKRRFDGSGDGFNLDQEQYKRVRRRPW